jgi:hypothetical protein
VVKTNMNDKLAHFIVGFMLSILGLLHFPLILSGFFFAIGKELFDALGHGTPETKDAIATACGAGIASGIVLLSIDYGFLLWH